MNIKSFLSNLTPSQRNRLGFVCWVVVAAVLGIFAWFLMLIREIYQWKHYNLSAFESDDVLRYTLAVVIGMAIHYAIILSIAQ